MSLVPPPSPRQLQVEEDPERGVVRLTWQVPAEPGCVSVVVRADGTRPPGSPTGPGRHVIYGQGAWEDLNPLVGQPMMYAVYIQRGGGGAYCERPAATTDPVLLARQPALSAVPGDRIVELSWNLPEHAAGVEVRREQSGVSGPPRRISLPDGVRQWTDREVANDVGYRYMAVALYEIASLGRQGPVLRRSKPASRDVTPTVPPELPGPLSAEGLAPPDGIPLFKHQVELGLPPVERGVLKVVRGLPGGRRLPEGSEFPEEELTRYGMIMSSVKDTWRDDGQFRRYTPVLVLYGRCYAGPTRDYARGPEVRDLAAEHLGAVVRVTWTWPDGVGKARVAWDEATEISDPANAARYTEVSRAAGAATGQCDIAASAGRLFVKVAAIVRDEAGGEYLTSGLPAQARPAVSAPGSPPPAPPRRRLGGGRRGPER